MVKNPNTGQATQKMQAFFAENHVTLAADGSEHESPPTLLGILGFAYTAYSLVTKAAGETL